jgi:hypothetical protein
MRTGIPCMFCRFNIGILLGLLQEDNTVHAVGVGTQQEFDRVLSTRCW